MSCQVCHTSPIGLAPSNHLHKGYARWCHWLSDKAFISACCHCHHSPAFGLIMIGQWYSDSQWLSPNHASSLMYFPNLIQISKSHMAWRYIWHLFRVQRSSDLYPFWRDNWVYPMSWLCCGSMPGRFIWIWILYHWHSKCCNHVATTISGVPQWHKHSTAAKGTILS